RELRALAARVRRQLPSERAPARPAPAAHAPRAGEPGRRALGRGDGRPQLADHRTGSQRALRAHGDPVRAARRERATARRPRAGRRRALRLTADRRARVRRIASLDWRRSEAAPGQPVIVRNARVLDPRTEIDAQHDVVIRDGEIAELAAPGAAAVDGAEVVDAEGLVAVPAFFDPHVHLRVPGREDKEDIETGTRAAAAGGYCGIIAMANTNPPVDTPAAIDSLRERARLEASVPVGFVATVTRGMRGEELTDMTELAAAGA